MMPGIPILNTGGGRHKCYGPDQDCEKKSACGNFLHALCGVGEKDVGVQGTDEYSPGLTKAVTCLSIPLCFA